MVLLAPALTVGCGLTNTVTTPVSEQPLLSMPVTVYIVVTVGEAVGLGQLVQDNPVAGDHVKVSAPVAWSVTPKPLHIVLFVPALTVGKGLTTTVTVSRSKQLLPFIPVTI